MAMETSKNKNGKGSGATPGIGAEWRRAANYGEDSP
jgi:hypothetical protein